MTVVEFVLNGAPVRLTSHDVHRALRDHRPDPIQVHWVEVDGRRWPPRQVFSLATGLPRRDAISHTALRHLRKLGFTTSEPSGKTVSCATALTPDCSGPAPSDGAADAFARLVEFMAGHQLTTRISDVEGAVREAAGGAVAEVAVGAGFDADLLAAALVVRRHAGRLNDVIHAVTILELAPKVMGPGVRMVKRPSLGAGNDPSRPFDLETNLRVAEVKVAVWTGADAMRMRTLFAEVVNLVLADTNRRRQLYTVGPRPQRWLRGGASVSWALGRSSPRLREAFRVRFGREDMTVGASMAGPGADVEVLDLRDWLPELR